MLVMRNTCGETCSELQIVQAYHRREKEYLKSIGTLYNYIIMTSRACALHAHTLELDTFVQYNQLRQTMIVALYTVDVIVLTSLI